MWFLAVESTSFACELLMAHPDAPLKGLWLGLRLGASLFIAPCLWLIVREAVESKRPPFKELGRGHLAAIGLGILFTFPVIEDAHFGVTFNRPDQPISLLHERIILGSMLGCISIFAIQVPVLLLRCRQLLAARTGAANDGWLLAPLVAVVTTWVFGLSRTLQCATHLPLWLALTSALLEATVTVGAVYFLLRRVTSSLPGDRAVTGISPSERKYARSNLTQVIRDRIRRKIGEVLATDAICNDSMMNLRSLSRLLNERAHYVSQVINQDLGANYYELVNRTRVERAQSLLIAAPERTVLEIALSVGYNSKSTFNTAFRRQTGVTPTEYRNRASGAAVI
jgi:AraC-like DNA-binding protein